MHLQHWGSSVQLDYDFEHAHAKLTYAHPFEMATESTGVEDLQRLDALRVQCGVERLRQEMRPSSVMVLIRVSDELRPGSEWPLVLELPSAAPVQVTGRVVRCEPVAVSLPAVAVLEGHYQLALTFVDPSTEAEAVLGHVCGTSVEPAWLLDPCAQ